MGGNKDCAVLIGAGELDNSQAIAIQQKKQGGAYIIALDGGLLFCANHSIEPDMIVGDFDSLEQELAVSDEQKCGSVAQELLGQYQTDIIYRLPCEKDDTDTLAAIKMAVAKGFKSFTIYGGLGGRLSHTMANIQSLLYLKERGLHGELVGHNSRIFLVKEECITLQQQEKGYISVFSYSEKAEGVTLKNLKYEIENRILTSSFPIGVSNEFVGREAEISVRQGVLLVVMEYV